MPRLQHSDDEEFIAGSTEFQGQLAKRRQEQQSHGGEIVPIMGLSLLCYLPSQETQGRPRASTTPPHRHCGQTNQCPQQAHYNSSPTGPEGLWSSCKLNATCKYSPPLLIQSFIHSFSQQIIIDLGNICQAPCLRLNGDSWILESSRANRALNDFHNHTKTTV